MLIHNLQVILWPRKIEVRGMKPKEARFREMQQQWKHKVWMIQKILLQKLVLNRQKRPLLKMNRKRHQQKAHLIKKQWKRNLLRKIKMLWKLTIQLPYKLGLMEENQLILNLKLLMQAKNKIVPQKVRAQPRKIRMKNRLKRVNNLLRILLVVEGK